MIHLINRVLFYFYLKTSQKYDVTEEADVSKDDVQLDTKTEITRRSSRRKKASRVDYKEVSTSDIEDKVNLCLNILISNPV